MYLFIAIIFIAELIIATTLICSIQKLDKKVLALDSQVTEAAPKLKEGLVAARDAVSKSVEGANSLCVYVQKQHRRYLLAVVKSLIVLVVFFVYKGRRKKYIKAVRLAMSLINLL